MYPILALLWLFITPSLILAQDQSPTADGVAAAVTSDAQADGKSVVVADAVQVDPVNSDTKIERRLTNILQATGWFKSPQVRVDRGVAFLSGEADSIKHQQWAEATAMRTSDVVAVVNRIQVEELPLWNFAPAIVSLKQLGREFTSILPLILIAIVVVGLSYYVAIASAWFVRWFAHRRIESGLLRQVAGNVVAVLVFIVGLYIALRVSGLTRLAVTLLGGTGLIGLALGFAFRDIAENYLASILISLNHPFRVGDLIEVEGEKGYVRKVTTRGTVLNTLEGNQIQMPNSTVYKGKITNYTATPLSRQDFAVGIGFDDSATEAQEIIMRVLCEHVAIVEDPAPLAIVQSLGAATVNMRVFYWFDQTKHSPLKVSSSVIRLTKQELTKAKITMPDEARELVFPQGVPVRMVESADEQHHDRSLEIQPERPPARHPAAVIGESDTSVGEGDLSSEQSEVMRATANDATVDGEANLIA